MLTYSDRIYIWRLADRGLHPTVIYDRIYERLGWEGARPSLAEITNIAAQRVALDTKHKREFANDDM